MKKTSIDFTDNEQRNAFLSEVTQQLTKAVSREDMRAVLADLPKNGLDALGSSENIDFPRALSRMKKDEMIAILLDEIIRRATIIKNGEELTVNGDVTPLMEAAYNMQGKSEYVAEAREKQRAMWQSLSDSVAVRVVNWDAVQEKKNPADNPVNNTEIQTEDITANKNRSNYSTDCEQDESLDVESNNTVQAFLQDNEDINLPDGVPSDFVPAGPAVVEIIPVSDKKVMHWGFKWHNDNFSTLCDEHLITAGKFLGLQISPALPREEIVKIITERVQLILQQTPDEETASCYGQDIVQQPVAPVTPVQRKSKLSALLAMADKECSAPLFTSDELQALTAKVWQETRRFAAGFSVKAHRWGRNVPVRKLPANESKRQYKIQF